MNLYQLVVESARRTPEAPAVREPNGRCLTYRDLDRLADRYAAALLDRGVRPGDRVVLWTAKSADAVALMQAALRIGAAYVPVGSSSPVVRVRTIVAECSPALVVTDAYPLDGCVSVDDLHRGNESRSVAHHPCAPDDLAYILFTSASTGLPKGVCISHRNALSFIEWATNRIGVEPEDRLANHAPFHFDLSVFDLYGAFRAGASVEIIAETAAYAPDQLVELIDDREITIWYSVPSALQLMIRQGGLLEHSVPRGMRACIFAGEPFPVHDVLGLRKAWPTVRLFNWYGPTETNVCTSHEVTEPDLDRHRPLPIGTPCSGDQVWLEPPGEGEIVVQGPTVMLGYWGAPPHQGPYRTGDLGRYDEHSRLEFLGRADNMVKVRGHRMELGEVEAVLCTHEAVAAAAVLVDGADLDAWLHAVVVPNQGHKPGLFSLKQHCAERLPSYMIVDSVHVVAELPRTANGKTDRARLATVVDGGELR
jgi:clorobiocin biosynthesis protein CloN4